MQDSATESQGVEADGEASEHTTGKRRALEGDWGSSRLLP